MPGNSSQDRTATKAQLESAYALAVAELRACLAAMREVDAGSETISEARRRAIEASVTARKAQSALLHFDWSPVTLEFLRVEERGSEEVTVTHRPHVANEPLACEHLRLRGISREIAESTMDEATSQLDPR